jgi:predicted amidohydrolase
MPASTKNTAMRLCALLLVALPLVGSCSDDTTPAPADVGVGGDGPAPDGPSVDATFADKGASDTGAGLYKVAALQYSLTDVSFVKTCTDLSDHCCGVRAFIKQAADDGARLIVVPDYAVYRQTGSMPPPEATPALGDTPATDARWPDGTILRTLAKLADDKDVTLVFNLITFEGETPNTKNRHTSLALDAAGKVLARHFKFQPHPTEASTNKLVAGTSVDTSFFNTPAGKAGILASGDVQCFVTGMKVTADCPAHSVAMLTKFLSAKPEIILFSAQWYGGKKTEWQALPVMKKVALTAKAWVVGANTRHAPNGDGGGIIKPDGTELKTVRSAVPTVVYGGLPLVASGDAGIPDLGQSDGPTVDAGSDAPAAD